MNYHQAVNVCRNNRIMDTCIGNDSYRTVMYNDEGCQDGVYNNNDAYNITISNDNIECETTNGYGSYSKYITNCSS